MAFLDHLDVIGPSWQIAAADVDVAEPTAPDAPTIWPVAPDGALPTGLTWPALRGAGFTGTLGELHVAAGDHPVALVGIGSTPALDDWRDATALGSRALAPHAEIAVRLPDDVTTEVTRVAVEGALLARYRYDALRTIPSGGRISHLTLSTAAPPGATLAAAHLGRAHAGATALARDLANAPHNHLTAPRFAAIAAELGADAGLDVEVWDQDRCRAERLGALLAVNAGSAQEARFVRLRYTPPGAPTGRLGLVGKGIMYDSGGIGLKPNDELHAQMKSDMTGAASVLAAMLALRDVGGTAEVVGYLMCTDNMPSATAMALGDVVRGRSGHTIEVVNTDAEGRVVMSDGITLAVEDGVQAIVDIATLTGAVARAFGPLLSGIAGSDESLVDALVTAATDVGEPVARVPLEHRYRPLLDSPVADIRNVGPPGPDAILSALFLHEFAYGVPWAHLDIAGSAWSTSDSGWRSPGCTGTGARTLLALASTFTAAG